MALVVICGQPCSGKSTVARCLSAVLEAVEPKPAVRIIDESSFHLCRNQSYADMTKEKNLRGVLRSEVDRSLSKDNIIIVDSLNNIKGYRYELWCLARAAGIRYCVERTTVGNGTTSVWKVKNHLMTLRYAIEESSPIIADVVSYLTKKVDSKIRDIRVLQPTIATQNFRTTEANSLYELDKATQEVINAIVEAQSQALGGCLNRISIGQHFPTINMERQVGLPELRSLRRTFMKLTGQTSLSGPPPPTDSDSAKRMFVDFLNREIGAC